MKLQIICSALILFLVACGNENTKIDDTNSKGEPTEEALIAYKKKIENIIKREDTSYEKYIKQFDEDIAILTGGNYTYEVNFVELDRMYEMAKESNEAAIKKLKNVTEIVPSIRYQSYALEVAVLSQNLVEAIENWVKRLKENQSESTIENTREIYEIKEKLRVTQEKFDAAEAALSAKINKEN